MSDILLVYITTPDPESARAIAEALVEEKLAACANIIPAINSVFYWDDKLRQSSESLLLLKTHQNRFDELTRRARELHPYELPCIVALPISAGLPDFLAWVGAAVNAGPDK